MWKYGNNPTYDEYISRLEYVESVLEDLGAEPTNYHCHYESALDGGDRNIEDRTIYLFKGEWFRVTGIGFAEKPFIVIEYTDNAEHAKIGLVAEDIDPFPYDWSDEMIRKEVTYELGIEPYPENWI